MHQFSLINRCMIHLHTPHALVSTARFSSVQPALVENSYNKVLRCGPFKGKAPIVSFHGITSLYSYFEEI